MAQDDDFQHDLPDEPDAPEPVPKPKPEPGKPRPEPDASKTDAPRESGEDAPSDTARGFATSYDDTYGDDLDAPELSREELTSQEVEPVEQDPPPQQPFPGATWNTQPAPAPDPAAASRRRRGWIVAIVAIALAFILIFYGISSCSSSFDSLMGTSSSSGDVSSQTTSDTVGIISLEGDIDYDGSLCSPEVFKSELDTAADDSHIKAVVIRVDSGGGTAAAGEEMTTYLKEFKETTGKPVVVSSASMNASAAYRVSAQADYIYTLEATSIGSIGTAMQFTDLSGFYELLGVDIDTIMSSDSKDSTYGTRPLSDEERAYYQDVVNQINEDFLASIAEGRHMSIDEVRELASGLTFTGADAVDNRLADELGTFDDALAKACELAGIASCDVVYLQSDSYGLVDLLSLLDSFETDDDGAEESSKDLGNRVDLER